jgi:hypothetical protein
MIDPPQASLGGAFARTARAREHILDLIARIEAFRQEQEQACSWEWDTDPNHLGEPTLVVSGYLQIPVAIGIIIGEVCYNLRSALDYLIYELAFLDSGKVVAGTQFPIEDKAKGFAWRKNGGWLGGINPLHEAAIEALQPYNGCNWTTFLRNISNPDKHRHLVLHGGHFQASLYADAERLRFLGLPGKVTRAKHPLSGKEVDVQLAISVQIEFSDGTPVIEALHELQAQVTQTLEAFQPEFQRGNAGGTHDSSP